MSLSTTTSASATARSPAAAPRARSPATRRSSSSTCPTTSANTSPATSPPPPSFLDTRFRSAIIRPGNGHPFPVGRPPDAPMNATPPACQPPPYPRRFGWPMRLFLTLFLFAITYRCFAILFPIEGWSDDFKVRRYPLRLSTLAELGDKAREASDENPHPVRDDLLETADSVWDYWKPWPGAE